MTCVRDAQRMADWTIVVACATEAIALARADEDLARLAAAAAALSHLTLWTVHQLWVVDADLVDDLRWALGRVGESDSPHRCRLLGALAVELYYDAGARAEREALGRACVDLARRLGDPALLWWATRAASSRPGTRETLEERLAARRESLAAAEAWGDDDARALALTALAGTLLELGDFAGYQCTPSPRGGWPAVAGSPTCMWRSA